MENASERKFTDAIRHNYKAGKTSVGKDDFLGREKKIKDQGAIPSTIGERQQQYTYVPAEPESLEEFRGRESARYPEKYSIFSPVPDRNKVTEEDERIVSSTTSNKSHKRSLPVCDSSTDVDPSFTNTVAHRESSYQRRNSRQTKSTETAAATSTTTFVDQV
ncbi:unnamed protein product [Clavelina lepadiformis]|uniref:Uncharacterized protein n=1 Tax=Clavelina lepadiformis TaxID=159417 RepID=A0ABP0EVP8_CLALP